MGPGPALCWGQSGMEGGLQLELFNHMNFTLPWNLSGQPLHYNAGELSDLNGRASQTPEDMGTCPGLGSPHRR